MRSMASLMAGVDIEVRACGIPCIARVTHYFVKKGDPYCKDSDLDYHGYTELEYDILDRRGRPAKWLEKKIRETAGADDLVYEQVAAGMKGNDHE